MWERETCNTDMWFQQNYENLHDKETNTIVPIVSVSYSHTQKILYGYCSQLYLNIIYIIIVIVKNSSNLPTGVLCTPFYFTKLNKFDSTT